ncbi:MAG TPA: DUF3341 domain-containing protein [Polyangiaceae bacterium]|jgi:hypothetical protein
MAAELWAEFADPLLLERAIPRLRSLGARRFDAHVPFDWPALAVSLGLKRPRLLPRAVFVAAALGALFAVTLIWWTAARSYPLNVGGRPLDSLPTDIPIAFETAVLFSASTAFVLGLGLGGMPRLHQKRDVLPNFARASIDRFWVGVLDAPANGAAFEHALREAGALRVVTLNLEAGQ